MAKRPGYGGPKPAYGGPTGSFEERKAVTDNMGIGYKKAAVEIDRTNDALKNTKTILKGTIKDVEGLTDAFGKLTNKTLGFSDIFKGGFALKALGMLGDAVEGLFNQFTAGVSRAMDLGETVSKVETVFKGSSPIIKDFAENLKTLYGKPPSELMDAATNIGLLGLRMGQTGEEAANFGKKFTQLAVDANSFYNIPLDRTLNAIRAGLVGEFEPLKAMGVTIDESRVKWEAFVQSNGKSIGTLTQTEKVMARASLITKQLAQANGDLERTANSSKNVWETLKGRILNTFTALGEKALPVFKPFIALMGQVAKKVEAMVNGTDKHFNAFVEFLQPVINLFQHFKTELWAIFSGLGAGMDLTFLKDFALAFRDTLISSARIGMAYATQLISWVSTIAGILIPMAVKVMTWLLPIETAFNGLRETLVADVLPEIQGFVVGLFTSFEEATGLGAIVGGWVTTVIDWLTKLRDYFTWSVEIIGMALRNAKSFLAISVIDFTTWAIDSWNTVKAFFGYLTEAAGTSIYNMLDAIKTGLYNFAQQLKSVVEAIYDTIASGFTKPFELNFKVRMEDKDVATRMKAEMPTFQAPEKTKMFGEERQRLMDEIAEREKDRDLRRQAQVQFGEPDVMSFEDAKQHWIDDAAKNKVIPEEEEIVPPLPPKAKKPVDSETIGFLEFARKLQSGVGKEEKEIQQKIYSEAKSTRKAAETIVKQNRKPKPAVMGA